MGVNYLYDGSFEGFLTCVYRHYYGESAEGVFPAEIYSQLDMLRYAMTIETDEELAARVLKAIGEKLSSWDAKRVYRVFRTNEPEKEMKLLRYLELGFKQGPKIRLLHGHPVVKDVEAADQRLGREVHRLVGLVRFSELEGGVLYSPITPDNDVLEFLAPHFSDRYRYDPFVIHDKVRGKALFAYDKKWRIEPFSGEMFSSDQKRQGSERQQEPLLSLSEQPQSLTPERLLRISESEEDYRRLWKQYFAVMATKERVNPKLQRQFVPIRYRQHLPEFES